MQVHPVVVRAGMARREFSARESSAMISAVHGSGLPSGCPPVVGVQVEHRLGGQQRDVGVARVTAGQCAQAGRVGFFVDGIGAAGGVAQRQRIDEIAKARRRRGPLRPRLAQRGVDALGVLRCHVGIDGRTQRPRQAPRAGGALGVQPGRRFERSRRLLRVEAPGQHHALLEHAPRSSDAAGIRGTELAHAVEHRRDLGRTRRGGVKRARGGADRQRAHPAQARTQCENFHGVTAARLGDLS
jgi:hypothetical protein